MHPAGWGPAQATRMQAELDAIVLHRVMTRVVRVASGTLR